MSTQMEKPEKNELSNNAKTVMAEIQRNAELILEIQKSVMVSGIHYGKIPGVDKPSLLKPGAEKLALTFQLNVQPIELAYVEQDGGHRTYTCRMRVTRIKDGVEIGGGIGVCSTLESKYRYRNEYVVTDKPVPKEYWDVKQFNPEKAIELLGGKGFGVKKDNGKWLIAKSGGKVENENPADQYNTVAKMAKKRAYVDAMLSCTAASDVYTQDVEDMREVFGAMRDVVDVDYSEDRPPIAPPRARGVISEPEKATTTNHTAEAAKTPRIATEEAEDATENDLPDGNPGAEPDMNPLRYLANDGDTIPELVGEIIGIACKKKGNKNLMEVTTSDNKKIKYIITVWSERLPFAVDGAVVRFRNVKLTIYNEDWYYTARSMEKV